MDTKATTNIISHLNIDPYEVDALLAKNCLFRGSETCNFRIMSNKVAEKKYRDANGGRIPNPTTDYSIFFTYHTGIILGAVPLNIRCGKGIFSIEDMVDMKLPEGVELNINLDYVRESLAWREAIIDVIEERAKKAHANYIRIRPAWMTVRVNELRVSQDIVETQIDHVASRKGYQVVTEAWLEKELK